MGKTWIEMYPQMNGFVRDVNFLKSFIKDHGILNAIFALIGKVLLLKSKINLGGHI